MEKTVVFSNGVEMPKIGLGLWRVPNENVPAVIKSALRNGYRSFDTATIYRNETGVGEALKECTVPRKELFISTKIWNEYMRQGTEEECFQLSLANMGLDYLDMCLIHWPVPGKYLHTWSFLIDKYQQGKVRVIGASNLHIHMMETMLKETGMLPMLLQVECNPLLTQKDLLKYCNEHGIIMQAYSPLMQGGGVDIPCIINLAQKYGKTPAQIILRWHLQNGVCIIPRSQNESRQLENISLFDFELEKKDMEQIDRLNINKRLCADPDDFDF